jgi:hypothetical protein
MGGIRAWLGALALLLTALIGVAQEGAGNSSECA